jgi:DNA-binding transcriptional MocR family regulator
VLVKQASDLNNSTINQIVMHRMAEAVYGTQVEAACKHYRKRRDAMLAALQRHMPAGASWTRPSGGLFVWLRLPGPCDCAELLQRAVAQEGVAFVPGAAFHYDGRGRNAMRLSYSLPSEAEIEDGIARLAKLI